MADSNPQLQAGYQTFRTVACILLGGMAGGLAMIPATATLTTIPPTILVVTGMLAGSYAGYKRRTSSFFFYMSLFTVLILIGILNRQG